jgi:UDPglucose--hexose-1-phosphate uridylyltransferase
MPEIRKDPVFGRWVIIAQDRGARPNQFRNLDAVLKEIHNCPFCPGNEKQTPQAVYVVPDEKNKCRWKIRVVPNKYPALEVQEQWRQWHHSPHSGTVPDKEHIYERVDGTGFHEVVIETPKHSEQLENMDLTHICRIFETYIKRMMEMKKDGRAKYIMIFKNYGEKAGASLLHSHSQIIAMPLIPIRVVQEIQGAKHYFKQKKKCVFCEIIRNETLVKKRIIGDNRDFVAIEPYASRFSFETWILPRKHLSHFEQMDISCIPNLSRIVKMALGKLKVSLKNLSYNFVLHSMPVQCSRAGYYHWHIEIMPKLSVLAGFEWGTGFYINIVPPEKAAAILNRGKNINYENSSCCK